MGHREHKEKAPKHVTCAVITVSDSRTTDTDESGKLIIGLLEEHGHEVMSYSLVKDDEERIRSQLESLQKSGVAQVAIVNGGTGVSSRDRTREAADPLIEREIDGFGELFRILSYEDIGSPAMLSRASAGVIGKMITFLLPGSPEAAELAMKKLILPELTHLVYEVGR